MLKRVWPHGFSWLGVVGACVVGAWGLSSASAQLFIGTPASALFTDTGPAAVGGLQLGTYDLYGLPFGSFGVRGVVEAGALGGALLVDGGIDALYSVGGPVVFYTGAGLGYTVSADAEASNAAFAGAFVGADFDAESALSLFVELNPHLYLGGGGLLRLRAGLNLHLSQLGFQELQDPQGSCCVIP